MVSKGAQRHWDGAGWASGTSKGLAALNGWFKASSSDCPTAERLLRVMELIEGPCWLWGPPVTQPVFHPPLQCCEAVVPGGRREFENLIHMPLIPLL